MTDQEPIAPAASPASNASTEAAEKAAAPPSLHRWYADPALAVVFLTRVPLPIRGPLDDGAHARAMAWFALVGLMVGFIGGGAYTLAVLAGLPAWPAALLAVGATAMVTGALHEDGLADMADGIGGGRTREDKLEIMRDSRLGTYGGLALMIALSLRVAAIVAFTDPLTVAPAMAAAGAISRAFVPLVAWRMRAARNDGLAAGAGRPPGRNVASCLMMGVAMAILLLGAKVLAPIVVAGLAVGAVSLVASRHLGGYTGDVLGAVQQCAEIAFLLALVTRP